MQRLYYDQLSGMRDRNGPKVTSLEPVRLPHPWENHTIPDNGQTPQTMRGARLAIS